MSTVDFQTAIKIFLKLGKQLQDDAMLLTGTRVLHELTDWYRTTRISGASPTDGGDMLLLQWGCGELLMGLKGPTDLRRGKGRKVAFEEQRFQFLDFTRQVCPDEDEDQFDDSAVQMSITLYYQRATGKEPESNVWIRKPKEIDGVLAKYKKVAYAKSLLELSSTRTSITVDHCG